MTDGEVFAARRAAVVAEWLADTLNSYPAETRQILTTVSDRFRNPAGHMLREVLPALFDALVSGELTQASGRLGDLVQLRAVQGFSREEAVAFVARLKNVVSEFAGPGPKRGAGPGLKPGAYENGRPPSVGPELEGRGLQPGACENGRPPSVGPELEGRGLQPGACENGRPPSVGPELQLGATRGLADLDARIDQLMAMALDAYDSCRVRIDAIRRHEIARRTSILERIQERSRSGRSRMAPGQDGADA